MQHRIIGAALAASALLAAPAAAHAHVSLQPGEAPAKALVVKTVRVPNEKDDAATTEVQVKFPPGFSSVSTQPVPGWSATVQTKQLDKPIETEDGPITVGVDTVTWTAGGREDGIQPGQFQEFPISLLMPDQPGATLTFKALQTYSDGDVVRWIGPPDADAPAATIALTEVVADGGRHGAIAGTGGDDATSTKAAGDEDHDSQLAIAGLIAGLLGLLAGGWALVTTRRLRRATAPAAPDPGT